MNDRLRYFFEFKVPLVSYFVLAIIIVGLYLYGFIPQPLTLTNAQIGGIIVFTGFILRTFATSTTAYLGKIKITGPYALCRHPLLLSQVITVFGLNIIMLNTFFMLLSTLVFFVNDYRFTKKYDKILAHTYKDIWKIYAKKTFFILPITKSVKNIFCIKQLSLKETEKHTNIPIFIFIYLILVEIATISGL